MRIGIAGEMHDWPAAARLGYEYFEPNLSRCRSERAGIFGTEKTAGRDRDTGGGV